MSAGRAAMWIIAGGIVLSVTVVLATHGVSGWPHEWTGLIGAAILATIAFVLGYVEE